MSKFFSFKLERESWINSPWFFIDSSLAFLIAAPLQFSGREINDDPSAQESFNNRTEAQSRNKLIKLYESYGFKKIPGGEGDMVAYIGDWFF